MERSILQEMNENMDTKHLKTDRKSCNTCASGSENSGTPCGEGLAKRCGFGLTFWSAGRNYTG